MRNLKHLIVVGMLGPLVLPASLRAEDKPAEIGGATVTAGKITEATPAKPSDRAAKSKAAEAAARAGAGLQKVMCLKMMADALQESDPTNKAIEQMMAAQACQQASETEKNADKNKDQEKLLTMDEIPKQASLTAGTLTMKQDTKKEAQLPMGDTNTSTDGPPPDNSIPIVDPVNPDIATLRKPTSAPEQDPGPAKPGPDEPTSPLKAIRPGTTNYDENAVKGSASAGVGGGGANFGGSRTLAQESGGGTNKAGATAEDGSGRGGAGTGKSRKLDSIDAGASNAGAGPGGGGGEDKGGSSEAFDALLAQMMGGGASAEFTPNNGRDIIVLPGKDESNKLPNIFEFANWRYQKSAFEEGRIRNKALKKGMVPETPKVASKGHRGV